MKPVRTTCRLVRTLLLTAPLLLSSCGHLFTRPDARSNLHAAAHTWHGREVALKHSHFYGELYEDNERILLSPHSFTTLYHRVDLQGAPIHPNPADGILAAGTRVVVESVEFPGPLAFLRRMRNAPTAHVWVQLRLADDAGCADVLATVGKRPLIAVLEGATSTSSEVTAAMADLFGDPTQTQNWLDALRPRVRAAIAHKQLLRGMRSRELIASQGEPWHWMSDATREGRTAKVAWYPSQEAWLIGDEVVDVRKARILP